MTTSSDVYSMGVVLYQILTGQLPYRFRTRQPLDVLRAVCEDEPEKPSTAAGRRDGTTTAEEASRTRERSPERLQRQLRGDLDTIVLTALRKEPTRRYPSMEALSEDLRRFVEGLPIRARKATFSYRAGKFVGRNRVGVAAAALVAILVLGFTAHAIVQSGRLAEERDRATREGERATRVSSSSSGSSRCRTPGRRGGTA